MTSRSKPQEKAQKLFMQIIKNKTQVLYVFTQFLFSEALNICVNMPLTFRLYFSYLIISYEKSKHSVIFYFGGSFLLRAMIRKLEAFAVSNGTRSIMKLILTYQVRIQIEAETTMKTKKSSHCC